MHVLLFDIDGTLISTGGAGGDALLSAFALAFGVEDPGRVPFSGRTDREIATGLFGLNAIEDTAGNWERLRSEYLRQLPYHLPRRDGRVLPGVSRLLPLLSSRTDCLVGLLTGNLREGARLKLEHYGIHHYFRCGGFGDEHRNRDDVAREALASARSALADALAAHTVWVLGDTPLDIRCARAIGARAVAVGTGTHGVSELRDCGPDLLLDDLSDTERLLASVGL